jgi:hypothetical protein
MLKELATAPLVGIKTKDFKKLVLPDDPFIFQDKLDIGLISRIRLVRACLNEVHPSTMQEWIKDFRYEPFPHNEILVWEYIAGSYVEVTGAYPTKIHYKMIVYGILLESTFFDEDLKERHATAWRTLPTRIRSLLQERMNIKAPFHLWREEESED